MKRNNDDEMQAGSDLELLRILELMQWTVLITSCH